MKTNHKSYDSTNNKKKNVVSFEDEMAEIKFNNIAERVLFQHVKVTGLEILRKIILFSDLDFIEYYAKIENLIVKSSSEKQIDKGVNKIAKQIISEIKSK